MEIMYVVGISIVGSVAYGIFKITGLTSEVESRLAAERQQYKYNYNYNLSQRAYIQQQTLEQEFNQYKSKYINLHGPVSIED